jgi:hypothetical protein
MKDDTQYKIKDLYGKFDDLRSSMNSGFSRIEKKLDDFIEAQAKREKDQDDEISDLKTKAAVQDTKQGMIAGGLTAFSTVAALITYWLTSK